MFRILLATGRSAQRSSPTPLRYIRHFHRTLSIGQQSSTASKPIHTTTESSKDSSSPISTNSPPPNSPFSTRDYAIETKDEQKSGNHPGHSHGAAEDTAKPIAPIQPRARNPAEENHDVLEADPPKPVKRGRGRPAKPIPPKEPLEPPKKRNPKTKPEQLEDSTKVTPKKRNPKLKAQEPKGPPKKRGPKPKPKPEEPRKPASGRGRKPKAPEENTTRDSTEGNDTVTFIENRARSKHSTFTTNNIRADYQPYLQWVRGHGQGKSIGDTRRINVVSESLCDDTLTRLEPSLQKHIGCDIIDVNPGVGIWSEKLHNFLKPRTHILVEPDDRVYRPVLQPLLDAPGSTYKLLPKSGLVWGHMEKILSREYLPHQEPLARGDPRLEEPNDTLLFVANLGHFPKRAYRGFSSMANLVLYQFMSAIRTHSLFQRYGHVRMLIWIESEERCTILPQTVSQRRKAAIEAEICCEKIQEVASSTHSNNFHARPRDLELESTRLVYEKMKKGSVTIPSGRESSYLEEITSGVPRDAREVGSLGSTAAFLEELRDLEAQYARGELGEWKNKEGLNRQKRSPKLARLRVLQNLENFHKRRFEKRVAMKTEYDAIFAMQRKLYGTTLPEKREAVKKALKIRVASWKSKVDDLSEDEREATLHYLENTRMFGNNPPSLMWDRRDYEPLKVSKDEFIPQREMCLLDIQPKSLWPILREDFPTNYDTFEYILSQLLIIPTQNIRRGFSALAPGAYDYLIAECPSLTDPTKGGSIDVELMSVRCLTGEMLKEIIEAWARWPFKPNRYEIMSKLGSTTYDPDAVATDGSDD
ncbi:S-adenosyl-L-methionine-dependent methyltransferase [Stipitochalara longipes BDJ]|nr:S-adenosyl-L-methionine-dependent methyltransferase [Stipitochalara longipes BDJ]